MPNLFENFALLNPAGVVSLAERSLMVQAVLFMLIVAVPVYILLFFFAWQYRASNTAAKYRPNWEHAKIDELIWWAIPFEIVLILGALTWTSTHQLDPKRALAEEPPLVVQVVALDWKWLFIYPEQDIASVNYARIPTGVPVKFEVTADAPMNSFWVPKLGGQIYAMTGMVNTLNLQATEDGQYGGMSANYSGEGFAKMKFTLEATSKEDFDSWVRGSKASSRYLTWAEYKTLALPGEGKQTLYSQVEKDLYNTIIMQFMGEAAPHTH